ncbi:hypothetical protein RIVM261_034080 [Rivularia sp. IAM M-261]|nr:hypothetical protein CAL7716_094150 [Calothrix sp. PCC 7716]GJD18452.1 hypothetical protein RIVM261_034080 [Rivularia sp. IAM M-261]
MSFNVGARIPLKSLILLCFAYSWLGWYLAAYHIVWLVGSVVTISVLAIIAQTTSWLESLIKFGSRTLVVVLFLSISIALVASWSIIFSLVLMPLATAMLADMELRFAGLSRFDRFLLIVISAGLSLAFGETVDLFFLPSIRY